MKFTRCKEHFKAKSTEITNMLLQYAKKPLLVTQYKCRMSGRCANVVQYKLELIK
jgi:hypothetical protein